MGVGDTPCDRVEWRAAQGPDRTGGVKLAHPAGGGDEVPNRVALRSLNLQMLPHDREVLGSQLACESEAHERPVGEEGQFVVAVVPLVAHIIALMHVSSQAGPPS